MAALSRSDLISVLRRTMDPGWLDAVLADPDSVATLNAIADALALVSLQGQVACDNTTISNSAAGRGGTSTLTLTRSATGVAGTIPQGYAFVDARGIVAVATSDVTVAGGAATVSVPVVTVRQTELVNTITPPAFVVAGNRPVADAGGTNALIGQSPAPAGFPPIAATTFIAVASATPIAQGASDWLSAVGRERGVLRQGGESDLSYRLRIRNVPDAVTPAAVGQAALGAASHGVIPPPDIQEPFLLGEDAANRAAIGLGWFDCLYMGGVLLANGNADQALSAKSDFFEDIQPDLVNLKVRETVSLREARCYFRAVEPGPLPDVDAERVFFDDGGFFDDPVLGYADVRDDGVVTAALMAVSEECNRKRAAGVRFDEYIDVTKRVSIKGTTTNASPVNVASVTPPVGKVWWLRDGHFGWDRALIGNAEAYVTFTFEDASSYTTPLQFSSDGQRVQGPLGLSNSRITQVDCWLGSDGVHTANLVVNLVVLEVVA